MHESLQGVLILKIWEHGKIIMKTNFYTNSKKISMNRKQFYSKSGWFGSKDLLKASGSDWGIIATALRNADWDLSDSDIARAHEIADSLDNIEKKN